MTDECGRVARLMLFPDFMDWRHPVVIETLKTIIVEHPSLETVHAWEDIPHDLRRHILTTCNHALTVAERLRGNRD